MISSPEIPTIDFASFGGPNPAVAVATDEARINTAQEIMDALCRFGFVCLKNHGIDSDLLAEFFVLAAQYFDRPLADKLRHAYDPNDNSGYTSFGQEVLNLDDPVDQKEAFNLRPFNGLFGSKETLPELFQAHFDRIEQLSEDLHRLMLRILDAVSLGLQIPAEAGGISYLSDRHRYQEPSGCTLRMLRYPPAKTGSIRCGGHTDYGSLTLLFQDSVGGLEVFVPTSETIRDPAVDGWIPVVPAPNTLIVNAGDLMEFWTGGLIRSAPHRVRGWPGSESTSRYSVAFFGHPEDSTPLDPIPSPLLAKETLEGTAPTSVPNRSFEAGSLLKRTMTAGEHLQMRLDRSYNLA
ncbi:uncharacterized protein BJ171DRAFT_514050 [Polychytrium aggregatum]|uniref:uncharacterized protein n=1 Tax=Polychytrium aggregatum TaxID=110093 RepID=UPI0022FE2481|nr:uncharacterized protein BJ171DRAFT_514050 [Polychytrium aggregatum]KAI9202432.1 hypothetical protein BJ171DRAFT_514050 [Polychytrium aggregatum]